MRKRRRLADKLTISVCAVLVAVSAFFYAPMEVSAEEVVALDEGSSSGSLISHQIGSLYPASKFNRGVVEFNSPSFTSNLHDNVLYKIDLSTSIVIDTNVSGQFGVNTLHLVSYEGNVIKSYEANGQGSPYTINELGNGVFYAFGSELKQNWWLRTIFFSDDSSASQFNINCVLNYTVNSILALAVEESDAFQNGYNAGYSAGEEAGYGNGYSNGFADGEASVDINDIYNQGFEAGKDSVDTQSYYDAGYQAGYQVAYSAGYSNGFAEGLKSAQDSPGQWQWYEFIGSPVSDVKKYGSSFYIAPYGLDDMEEYQNGSNGYYHNTVPSVYDGYSTINYLIPFDGVTEIDADSFLVEMTLSNLISGFDINTGSGAFQNSLVSSEVQEVYLTFNGRKYFGNIGKYTSGSHGYVNFSFIVDDVIPPVELNSNCMALTFVIHNTMFANVNASQYKFVGASCSPYVSFNVGSTAQGYAFRVRPFIKNDRVSANIQNQTDNLTNGFNDSKGNSVNNDFSAGLNDFETAEDSLFATATSGMKDFTFFDINSVPAMLTGMSFVGSIMTGWFNQAGGVSGVGIVLSILFSIMLVAMVLGLYRWYQSKGGKD